MLALNKIVGEGEEIKQILVSGGGLQNLISGGEAGQKIKSSWILMEYLLASIMLYDSSN